MGGLLAAPFDRYQVVTSALELQEVVKCRERGEYEAPPGTLGAGGVGGREGYAGGRSWG